MIFSQKQSENIQEGKFEETRHNKLGSLAFVIICLTHDHDAFADQLYRHFILFQTISNDVYGFHRISVLVPYFEQFCSSVDEIMNLKNWIKSIPLHMVRFLSTLV